MSALTGTGGMARLILRRDRFLLPLWIIALGLLPLVYASATDELYPDPAGLREYYASISSNPSLLSTIGRVYAPNLGALVTWRAGILAVVVGVISLLTVVRHTRAEEDAGRRDLLGSTVAGRQAPLAAALLVTGTGTALMGTVMTVGLLGYGLPTTGAVAFGVAFATTGWMFAGITAVAVQLTQGAGAARGLGFGVVGLAFVLRAAGDSAGEQGDLAWLSWLSPLGWMQRLRPFADERWSVLGLVLGLVVVTVGAAAVLQSRRDVGAGALPQRLGPAEASIALRGPFGLAWRLHRGLLLGWSVGFAVIGLVFGGAADSIDGLVKGSSGLGDLVERLGGVSALKDTYFSAVLGMMALAVGAYAIQAALRARVEETATHAEPVLATAVGRMRWLGSHLLFVAVGPAVTLAVLGTTTAIAASGSGGLGDQLPRLLAAALVHLPAVWLLAALTVAMFALLPRAATAIAWTAFAGCVFLTLFGALLQLDDRIMDISPFTHIPKLPGGDVTAAPLIWLLALTVVLTVLGALGFRRRDIAA